MDKNTDDFWTDELVKEFINFSRRKMHISDIDIIGMDIEKFKQLNSKKEEPQWEILSVFDDDKNPIYNPSKNIIDVTLKYNGERIHSVKRFPDNTVWSVDMVTEHGIITAFKIIDKDMWAVIKGKLYEVPLVALEEALPKETPKPEWEILKLEIGGVNYPIDALNEKEKSIAKIYSVKRLSDGEVFSVWDYVNRIGDAGTIHGFQVKEGWSGGIRVYFDTGKIMGTAISEIQKVNPKTAPKEEQVPHRCKYCNALVTSDSDEGCYANPNRINEDIGSEEKQEEQVPIKKEIIAFGRQRDPNGFWYEFYSEHPIPTEKYQSIKSAIKDVLNNKYKPWKMYQTGFTSEELLQARRDAFSSGYTRGWHNGCFEEDKTLSKKITDKKFEDYINSLK